MFVLLFSHWVCIFPNILFFFFFYLWSVLKNKKISITTLQFNCFQTIFAVIFFVSFFYKSSILYIVNIVQNDKYLNRDFNPQNLNNKQLANKKKKTALFSATKKSSSQSFLKCTWLLELKTFFFFFFYFQFSILKCMYVK